jgi:thiamine biosynthesis lipoprotein
MDALISPQRRTLLQVMGAAALVAGCGEYRASTATAQRPQLHFAGATMGSSFNVKIAGAALSPEREAAARAAVQAAFDDVVAKMSTHDAASELSRFNRHASTVPFALSPDTLQVFALARAVSEETRGAFDITVAPLVDAWGFGPSRHATIPAAERIRALQPAVGYRQIAVDRAAGAAAKERPAVAADLSGIAKGYGVDVAARALEQLGHTDFMVEAGGEVRTRGNNAAGRPWQIAIERPDAVPQRAHFITPLAGQSMATSGDYRIFFEQDGRRYSHEIDPSTGAPATHRLASVSVVAADCAYADAMATALYVLGPQRGHALATERGLAAYFIVREADGSFTSQATAGFERLGGALA